MANGKSGIEEDLATHLQPSVQMATLELIINEEPLQKQNLQKCCQCNANYSPDYLFWTFEILSKA